jgi:hypothetical protein
VPAASKDPLDVLVVDHAEKVPVKIDGAQGRIGRPWKPRGAGLRPAIFGHSQRVTPEEEAFPAAKEPCSKERLTGAQEGAKYLAY